MCLGTSVNFTHYSIITEQQVSEQHTTRRRAVTWLVSYHWIVCQLSRSAMYSKSLLLVWWAEFVDKQKLLVRKTCYKWNSLMNCQCYWSCIVYFHGRVSAACTVCAVDLLENTRLFTLNYQCLFSVNELVDWQVCEQAVSSDLPWNHDLRSSISQSHSAVSAILSWSFCIGPIPAYEDHMKWITGQGSEPSNNTESS